MMGSQITLPMSLIMIGLFSIAIFSFAISFAEQNDAAIDIADDTQVQSLYSDTKDSIGNLEEKSEKTYQSIVETTVEPGSDVAQSSGAFAVSIGDLKDVAKNVIFIPYRVIFGSGKGFSIFFTIFGAVIAMLFGLYLYKTLRGNP